MIGTPAHFGRAFFRKVQALPTGELGFRGLALGQGRPGRNTFSLTPKDLSGGQQFFPEADTTPWP